MKLCEHGWPPGVCSREWCPHSKRSDEALEERAQIVEWLREQYRLVEADPTDDAAKRSALLYWRTIADAIERGVHVK